MIVNLFSRLKAGETIHACADDFQFDIQPAYWHNIVLGFTLLVDGQVVVGRKGIILDKVEIDDWATRIDEQ